MLSWVLAKSCGMVLPRAVVGLLASRSPTAPAKWTSPPKPRVTACRYPSSPGSAATAWESAGRPSTAVLRVVEEDWSDERRRLAAAAAREEDQPDQEQEEHSPADGELPPPPADPA